MTKLIIWKSSNISKNRSSIIECEESSSLLHFYEWNVLLSSFLFLFLRHVSNNVSVTNRSQWNVLQFFHFFDFYEDYF